MSLWERRIAKALWAKANPDKVRRANRTYRETRLQHTNAQAAARMRRYRARVTRAKYLHLQSSD